MSKKGDVSAEIRLGNNVIEKNPNSAAVWHYGGLIADKKVQQKLRRYWHLGRTMSTCAIQDDILYISDLDGILHCLDANNGKLHWEHNSEAEIWGSPMIADGKVYLGTDAGEVFVFEHGRQKKLLAQFEMDGRIRRPMVAVGNVLYVQTDNRLYAFARDK
jgi:outer membrane protein assembly factor BamB